MSQSPPSPRPLDGHVALVTGGVRRIGRATALALAAEGAALVINSRTSAGEAAAVVAEIEAAGGRAMAHLADVTDEAAVAGMMAAVEKRFGRLDILVNNAAIRAHVPFTDMTLADWRGTLAVILDGSFLCARAAIPMMQAAGAGAIVNIGGMTAHIGAHQRAHVSAAKAGLLGLTKALAVEFAADAITVNCVVPGKIGGPRSATSGAEAKSPGAETTLLGHTGTPEDVATVVRMLCLPSGRFMTGQIIHVNGGVYLP